MHYILWLSCELVFEKVVTIYSLLLCHMRYQQGLVEHDTPATKHPPLPLLHTPHIINNIFQPLLRSPLYIFTIHCGVFQVLSPSWAGESIMSSISHPINVLHMRGLYQAVSSHHTTWYCVPVLPALCHIFLLIIQMKAGLAWPMLLQLLIIF